MDGLQLNLLSDFWAKYTVKFSENNGKEMTGMKWHHSSKSVFHTRCDQVSPWAFGTNPFLFLLGLWVLWCKVEIKKKDHFKILGSIIAAATTPNKNISKKHEYMYDSDKVNLI